MFVSQTFLGRLNANHLNSAKLRGKGRPKKKRTAAGNYTDSNSAGS